MPRSPLVLAALATAAVPDLDASDVQPSPAGGSEFDVAMVTDTEHQHWVIRAPTDAISGAALEAEVALLDALAAQVDAGALPFDVPRPAGFARLDEGGRACVHRMVRGVPLSLETLQPGLGLATALGEALGALHQLPTSVVEDTGLPVYDPKSYRRRRQAEIDEAAATGKVPAGLLRRWEQKFEDVRLWRFQPTVVHGDLTASHVLVDGSTVTGILDWGEAMVADPADDLAWLLVAAPPDAAESIVEAYRLVRADLADPHLVDRALLAGELALARWLLFGVRTRQQDVIEDAVTMLTDLQADLDAQAAEPEPGAAAIPPPP